MVSWWMNEKPIAGDADLEDDEPTLRKWTVTKRPTSAPVNQLPPRLTGSYGMKAICSGKLEKLTSSFFLPQWQERYWELRGSYLFYFDPAFPGASSEPLGAIDLRHIESISLKLINGGASGIGVTGVITLKSIRREFLFRESPRQSGDPVTVSATLQEWLSSLNAENSEQRRIVGASPEAENTRDESSGVQNDEVIISDVFRESLANEGGAQNNPMRETAATAAAAGDVELQTIQAVEEGNKVLLPGSSIREPTGILPLNLNRALWISGITRKNGSSFALSYMWAVRLLVVATLGGGGTFYVWSSFLPKKNSFYKSVNFDCAQTLVYRKGEALPCVLKVPYVAMNIYTGLAELFIYVWLIKKFQHKGAASTILRTHRARMNGVVNRFASILLKVWSFGAVALTANEALISYFSNQFKSQDADACYGSKAISNVESLMSGALIGGIMSLVLLPVYVFVLLYHAETRRLRFLLKDFEALMRQVPFDFKGVAPVHLEIETEWNSTAKRFGFPVAVIGSSYGIILFTNFMMTFYYRAAPELECVFNYLPVWIYVVAYVTTVLPPFALLLHSIIAVNGRATALIDQCIGLIATDSGFPRQIQSSREKDSTVHLRGNRRNDGEAVTENEISDKMALVFLLERRPLRMLVFGQLLTWSQIKATLGLLVFAQLLSILGLGSTS